MINDKNLDKLYEGIISGEELTTKVLNGYGFNSKDLSDLIDKGVLQRVRRGYYSFVAVDDLYRYGKKFIYLKDYEKANKCFERCYILDPNHGSTCFQLFLSSVNKYNCDLAFKYFDVIFKVNDPYYEKDLNFYLYLLNVIINVPKKYKEYVKHLKFEDICIDINDKRYRNKSLRNKIRKAAFHSQFPFALQQLNDLIAGSKSIMVQDILIKSLLVQASTIEKHRKNELMELIKLKQYEQVVSILLEKQEKRNLNISDSSILKLAEDILYIQKTQKTSKPKTFKAKTILHAIQGCNYQLALKMCEKFNLDNNVDNSKNAIYLLLDDICNLINEISNLDKNIVSEPELLVQDISKVEVYSAEEENVSFSEVVKYLLTSDIDNAFNTLKTYMESIGKSEYEFLILDLIKLSLIEKDIAFTKPMVALSHLSRNGFKFDVSSYIQDFYLSLAENKFEEARIYLDIICNANKIDKNYILTDSLLQVLDNTEKTLQYRKSLKLVQVDDSNKKNQETVSLKPTREENSSLKQNAQTVADSSSVSSESETVQTSDTILEEVEQQKTKVVVMNSRNSEEEFIENKHNLLLKNKGIILLKPMNNERRKRVHELVERYPDMVSFSIGEDANRQVVLRYKPIIAEYVNYKALSNEGEKAYYTGDYDGSIDKFLQLLQAGKNPPIWVYAKLGLCYLKKNCLSVAIDYLTVANYLNKKENGKFDYTDLIARLKGSVAEDDAKPIFKMNIREFGIDENNYGIKNIDQITEFVSETGLDVESACKHFGMNDEQIDTVRLIYAKDFYSQGWYEKGDEFLKTVERSKHKTKFTTTLLREVQRDKKFYVNRPKEKPRQLSLTMKPKKPTK